MNVSTKKISLSEVQACWHGDLIVPPTAKMGNVRLKISKLHNQGE